MKDPSTFGAAFVVAVAAIRQRPRPFDRNGSPPGPSSRSWSQPTRLAERTSSGRYASCLAGRRSAGPITAPRSPSGSSSSWRTRTAVRIHCDSGGGGNRTPVRRCIRERIYVRSLRIVLAALAPAGGISRGQPAFGLGPRAAGARGGPARSMTLEPTLRAQAGRAWRPN
jgi:hypothetical protein